MRRSAWPAYLALLGCCAIYSFQEFVLHGVVLHVAYHSVYLVVPLFVLAGVIFGELWRDVEWHREWLPTLALVLFAIALPHIVDVYRKPLFGPGLWTRMFVAGGIAILLVAGWHTARTGFRAAIAFLLMPLLFAGPASESSLYTSINTTSRDDFRALMSFNDLLQARRWTAGRCCWVDRDEPDYYLFVSAQSLWIFGGYDFGRAFRGPVPQDIHDQLSAKTTLVHLTITSSRGSVNT